MYVINVEMESISNNYNRLELLEMSYFQGKLIGMYNLYVTYIAIQ